MDGLHERGKRDEEGYSGKYQQWKSNVKKVEEE